MTIYNRFLTLLAEKGIRENRRISIAEVSRETGITRSTLQGWANNTISRFDAPVIEALCLYFDCEPGNLIERTS